MTTGQRVILFAVVVAVLVSGAVIAASPNPRLYWACHPRLFDDPCSGGPRLFGRELNLDDAHRFAYATTAVALVGGVIGLPMFRVPRPGQPQS